MSYTPPSILEALKDEFELSDAQFDALPPLSEVDLVRQNDSHLIEHATLPTSTYHPYKLFIGEVNNDAFHVYLYRATGSKRQCKMEITSVDLDSRSHYDPIEAIYYGTIRDLAYPFNSFLGAARFVAVVKWYFTVGLRTGVFDEDPGFALSSSWRRDLQGACNELIAVTKMEEYEKQRDEAKRVEKEERVREKRRRESLEAVKQVAELRQANDTAANHIAKARRHTQQSLSPQQPAPIMDYDGSRNAESSESEQMSSTGPDPTFIAVKTRGDRRREGQGDIETSRSVSRGITATNENSRRRAQRIREAQGGRLDAGHGRAREYSISRGIDDNNPWQGDERRRPVTGESPEMEGLSEHGTSDTDAEAASLEAEYTELFRQREKINNRMRVIQSEMSAGAFQVLLERIVDA
ncbi:hypothetical protein EKO04_006819 [Ascochyta lentis]|uniref:Uncharacterized protein n=1 Tax=Ascochyta lentis TaxID=205686 RepID=A0A8H7MCW7_9PLEO|nr:hypothetical protein EKO04_006819 [Ascochyta lentis]